METKRRVLKKAAELGHVPSKKALERMERVRKNTGVHTVTVVLRVRSNTPQEAQRKVDGIFSTALAHWPKDAWSTTDIRDGWHLR